MVALFIPIVYFATIISGHVHSAREGDKGATFGAIVFVGLLCIIGLYRVIQSRIQHRWYARGVPRQQPISFAVKTDGLHISSDLARSIAYWPSFNELAVNGEYWVLLHGGFGVYVPRRFFTSPSDERAFVFAVFQHLSLEARARSREAEKVLSSLSPP